MFQDGILCGVLEIIPTDVILNSKEFNTVSQWLDYLKELTNKKVIKLISAGEFIENGLNKVFVEYEMEPGFQPIAKWIKSDSYTFDEKVTLNVILKIIEKMEQTKLTSGFYFQNVNPCTVLWNPEGEIKLLNIGTAFLMPKYVCGGETCNKKSHNDELGKTTGIYFLGLLAVQVMTDGECPVLNLDFNKNLRKKKVFYEAINITPHLKSIIARTVKRATYQYGNLKFPQTRFISCNGFHQGTR